jgi:hypothetical protein
MSPPSGLTDSGEVSIPADDFVPPGFAAAEVFVEPNLLACLPKRRRQGSMAELS